ncbi:uncharacterized protein LOC106630580 [Zonotrichia albicollis]|uniref:uncharacterized protein LOC106630580 n=1 Tax=Zonotrichia albicollis TaxID=44394 RepID=UPI003D80FE92
MLLPVSTVSLYWDLVDFTESLWVTLYCTQGTWWHRNVTYNDGDPLTSVSQALAAYDSTTWTSWDHVTMAARKWQRSVSVLVNSWAQLARKATKLHNTCKEVDTEAADRATTATAQARELQDKAARDGTAQENMVELGQALGGEEGAEVVAGHGAQVRREARVAASEATRATMERPRVEASLGLLERLVAACDEATTFPRELQRRGRDIEAALKWTNMGYFDIPEDLVAKVVEAERLWEANARLAKDHLLGAVPDVMKFYFTGGPTSPSLCEVAERCQRATEDIPRLLRTPESPQSIPEGSPVSMELPELSPALLQPQVTVVAILGELLDTLPRENEMLPWHAVNLRRYIEEFATELGATLKCVDDTWWRRDVTSSDDDPVTSLSQALAAYKSTPGTTRNRVTMAASKWQESMNVLMKSWAWPASEAAELRNICREVATKVLARDATMATMVRQRVEAALELVQRLVAAFDEATAFPRELQRLLRDIETTLEGTNEAPPNVPEDLVAKVAMAERLWEANARLATRHLLGTLPNFMMVYFTGAPSGPNACEVAERCQRATEDIPRLLRPLECPQSVPNVFLMSMDPQELSPALLQPQLTVVATLGELLDTLPRLHEEMLHEDRLPWHTESLYWNLEHFTGNLRAALYSVDDTWWRDIVTSSDDDPVTSLSQALAAYESTPGTAWDNVTMAASKWHRSVSELVDSWAWLVRKATKLRHDCRDLATRAAGNLDRATAQARKLRDKAARYGTAQENMVDLGQALGREEGAEVVAGHETWLRREAREAASKATRATMVRQRLEAALGLLERLVAACDKATAFPWKLRRRVGDINTALKGTNEVSPNVPEDLVAKVAEAERLWEANARLGKDHLLGALQDIKFSFTIGPDPHNACVVAERC